MTLAVVDALRDLVTDDEAEYAVDRTGARPFDWEPDTLYAYELPESPRHVPFEAGPSVQEEFDVALVLVGPAVSEEATRERDREVTELLDQRRAAILDAVRTHPSTSVWAHVQARAETPPRSLKARAAAVRVTGYRIVTS